MKNDIIRLFSEEYNLNFDYYNNKFEKLYEDEFQRDKCIRVVAIIDDKIIGFNHIFTGLLNAIAKTTIHINQEFNC